MSRLNVVQEYQNPKYIGYDGRTHVYMKSDTYIGSDEKVVREEYVYDFATSRIVEKTIDFTPGCERLYLEILSNAADNVGRSRRAKVDPGTIIIEMDNKTIKIKNFGLPIPIELHPVTGVYNPEMIFGSLYTSSNYETDRHEAGTNGIGAKATNIFSLEFMVIVEDSVRKLKYRQIWKNNMVDKSEPEITKYDGNISSVEIVYNMDFARFGYPIPTNEGGGYPLEAFELYTRHAMDLSCTAKVPVKFNGTDFNFSDDKEYFRLYLGDVVENSIVHYQWPEGTEVIKTKSGYQYSKDPAITPIVEIVAVDTPDNGRNVSFVNCIMTKDGGVHINAAVKAITETVVQTVNSATLERLKKRNKGKELTAQEKKTYLITANDVKKHISLFVNVKVLNPKFSSQTKTSLQSPTPKILILPEQLKSIKNWELMVRLNDELMFKHQNNLSKKNGKLTRYIKLKKGVDANNAGGAQRDRCTLYITEGKSGVSYASTLMGLIEGGRDYIGILPMKGKGLNVMNASTLQLSENKEIQELVKMLGLKYCSDNALKSTFYFDQNNYKTLRYGGLMIMADADVDGKHIIGLILNFFFCYFPSLLHSGYVTCYKTPILRTKLKSEKCVFYNQVDYDNWKLTTPNFSKWQHKYFKGLGSSNDKHVKEDFQNPRVITFKYDNYTSYTMRLAFDKKLSDKRKFWISDFINKNRKHYLDSQIQNISNFLNNELILFSIADIERSIPKLTDGLKESHRKILFGANKNWNISLPTSLDKSAKNPYKKVYTPFKVAQFSNFVANVSGYHHGEVNLDDVIVGMAQDFVGSNNIPWFTKDGQFGCVHPDTPILLFDGSVKSAKDVALSDILVGDDGNPRHISKIVSGSDEMYEICNGVYSNYIVNSKHILTLRYSKHKFVSYDENKNIILQYYDATSNIVKRVFFKNSQTTHFKHFLKSIPDENVFDINIKNYLSLTYDAKDFFPVYNNCPIKFDKEQIDVKIDPFEYGLRLVELKPDKVCDSYKYNSKNIRLSVLAGFYQETLSGIFILARPLHDLSKNLIDDLIYIARSLGFVSYTDGNILYISNENNNKPISIKHIGVGEYVGWYIDGNERFLLGDFTVTHNTRYEGGKDASQTRYSHTRPDILLPYIIRKEDEPILEHMVDDGQEIEPRTYYPIFPMILINGAKGIGTGHSTDVPCHNPLEIINWYKLKLSDAPPEQYSEILPWYRGFKGRIDVIDRRAKSKTGGKIQVTTIMPDRKTTKTEIENLPESFDAVHDEDGNDYDQDAADYQNNDRPLLSMVSTGIYQVEGDKIIITELPIGKWSLTYRKWLEDLVEDKKIKGYNDKSVGDIVYFEIIGFNQTPNHNNLHLKKVISMSNMVLLDENNRPIRYDTVYDILESFYARRLPVYKQRKDHILNKLQENINELKFKIQFIQAVIDKKIKLVNKHQSEIYDTMTQLGIPHHIYKQSKTRNLSTDDIVKLQNCIADAQKEIEILSNTPHSKIWYDELVQLETVYTSHYNRKLQKESNTKTTRSKAGIKPNNSRAPRSQQSQQQSRQQKSQQQSQTQSQNEKIVPKKVQLIVQ